MGITLDGIAKGCDGDAEPELGPSVGPVAAEPILSVLGDVLEVQVLDANEAAEDGGDTSGGTSG